MRCIWYVNACRIDVRLNSKPLEEVDRFKYLGSQLAMDEGCQRKVVQKMTED